MSSGHYSGFPLYNECGGPLGLGGSGLKLCELRVAALPGFLAIDFDEADRLHLGGQGVVVEQVAEVVPVLTEGDSQQVNRVIHAVAMVAVPLQMPRGEITVVQICPGYALDVGRG